MAPVPTTPLHTHVARHESPLQTWRTFMVENEQPTAAMCLAFLIVTLLVLALLLYTGRRWNDDCNSSSSFRRRICQRCRDNASAQAARLRTYQTENMELNTGATEKKPEGPASWHGSNMLNTSWGWMS